MSVHFLFELQLLPPGIEPTLRRVLFDSSFVLLERVGYERMDEHYDAQVNGINQGFEVLLGFLRDFGNCSFVITEIASGEEIIIDVDEKSFGFLINARLSWSEGDCRGHIMSWAAEFFDEANLRLEFV